MTNEFKHKTVGEEQSQAEFEAIGGHIFDSQSTGDILYASSSTQLSRLGIGSTNQLLTISGGVPAWITSLSLGGTLTIGEDGTGYDTKLYSATAGSYLEWDESADQLNLHSTKSSSGNAIYLNRTCSATSGNIYGLRMFVSGTGASTGMCRGIRCEADMGDTASASLLEAGLFTAKVSSGSATVTNIRALTGHLSIGSGLTVSGDVVCVNAHMQTRSDESISGTHATVYCKNEAVGGSGLKMDAFIYCTTASLGGSAKGADYLIDGGTDTDLLATAFLRVPDDAATADADGGSTADGWIKVVIGTQTTYIPTYNTAH